MEQLADSRRQRIEAQLGASRVVLFMKGTPDHPQCGFSAATVNILDSLEANYTTVNVLDDPAVRSEIKLFSDWPTIPQLYIDSEFVGGCDIVKQLFNSGDLHHMLGLGEADRTPPEMILSESVIQMFRNAQDNNPGMSVYMSIDKRWQTEINLRAAEGHEIRASIDGIEILMDLATTQRARGIHIDLTETIEGTAFEVHNPNAPPTVKSLSALELRQKLDHGEHFELIDVRGDDERAIAVIGGSQRLDEERMKTLERQTPLVFICRSGRRSRAAAEHYRLQGFVDVTNLSDGTNGWATTVDPSMTQY